MTIFKNSKMAVGVLDISLSFWRWSFGWVLIQMAMGECSAYCSLQADSKVKIAAWPTRWRSPGADRPTFAHRTKNKLA